MLLKKKLEIMTRLVTEMVTDRHKRDLVLQTWILRTLRTTSRQASRLRVQILVRCTDFQRDTAWKLERIVAA